MTDLPLNRTIALSLFTAVLREGRPLEEQADLLTRPLDPRDRGFVRMLVATTLRRLGQIDMVINHFLDKPMPAKLAPVRDIMRLGAAQILFLDTPGHAVVDTSVELVKRGKLAPYSGLANAVLRRISRDGTAIRDRIDAARFNTPKWLWLDWCERYGEETAHRIGQAHLAEAPLDITLRDPATAADWTGPLSAEPLPGGSLRRLAGGAVYDLPGFTDGHWWVQDAAAALPVRLMGDLTGKSVADLCAAPGGKTLQLAAAGATVTAVDRSARRLRRVSENLARTNLTATLVDADATEWRPEALLDAVLLDAPCSATGTIRRHPDVARHKRPDDVAALAETQAALLAAAADMVKPGGMLVYCTCSLQKAEGEDQIAAALAAGLPWLRDPIRAEELPGLENALTPDGEVRTLPCHLEERGGMDGFFIARLRRA